MEKLLEDIPKPREGDKYRQFLLALSLSPLSQEPPMENWEDHCRQQNDCCVVSVVPVLGFCCFIDAFSHLYKKVCQSVGPLFVHRSVTQVLSL